MNWRSKENKINEYNHTLLAWYGIPYKQFDIKVISNWCVIDVWCVFDVDAAIDVPVWWCKDVYGTPKFASVWYLWYTFENFNATSVAHQKNIKNASMTLQRKLQNHTSDTLKNHLWHIKTSKTHQCYI